MNVQVKGICKQFENIEIGGKMGGLVLYAYLSKSLFTFYFITSTFIFFIPADTLCFYYPWFQEPITLMVFIIKYKFYTFYWFRFN